MKKIARYSYDVTTNTLTMSTAFEKKASTYATPEFHLLMELRRDHPGLTIEVEPNKKTNHSILNFAQMENHIKQCQDADKRMATFDKVKKLSKSQTNPYAYVKKWFLENYANYSETPELDENNHVIVKTKKELEAEKKKAEIADKGTSPAVLTLVKDETAA